MRGFLVFWQRKVQLLSPDKQTFEVEWDVAMRSTVVKQMLEGRFVLAFVHKLILSDSTGLSRHAMLSASRGWGAPSAVSARVSPAFSAPSV